MIAPCENNDEANLPRKTPGASNTHSFSPSISSELTITPQRLHHQSSPGILPNELSPTRLAGIVGIFTGCGALLALSVAISLFIPLFVNAYYISSGLCDETGHNTQDAKKHCREAYVLAAELTGVSQLVALLFAPVFGFLADRYRRFNIPLLTAALIGLVGYIALASLASPQAKGTHGTLWIFVVMALLGISQIGAIAERDLPGPAFSDLAVRAERHNSISNNTTESIDSRNENNTEEVAEGTPLLRGRGRSRNHLKGSIAGVYSLAGGVGILLLTKVGGLLFDKVSPVAPFIMISAFNFLLLAAGIAIGISNVWKSK
ncbi:MAG: hypothetical protein Q9175_004500 [Cornicularia normoerica]